MPATSVSAIDRARFGPFQLRVAALCAFVAALDGFDTQAIAYVAPSIAEAWGLDSALFGRVFGAGLLGLTVGACTLGPLADRVGRKAVILLSTSVFGLFALLTSHATTLNELLLLRFLTGIGLGGAMPNLIALTNEYAPERLKATLVVVMFCGFPLGSTLGGLAAAPLIAAYGWQSVFIVGGSLPLVLLPALAIFLPESARFLATRAGAEPRIAAILRRISPEVSASEFVREVASEQAVRSKPRMALLELFAEGRTRITVLLWIAFFMNLLVMYFLVNWLPSLLRRSGLPLNIATLSTAILNLGGVIGAIVLGRLIDRRNPYLVLSSAYAAAALFIAVVAYSGSNVPLLLSAAALAGFGVVGAQIGLNAVTASLYPTTARSTGLGWALGVGRVGSILGPVAGGVLLGLGWSTRDLLLAAVVPALLAALAVRLLYRPIARGPHTSDQ